MQSEGQSLPKMSFKNVKHVFAFKTCSNTYLSLPIMFIDCSLHPRCSLTITDVQRETHIRVDLDRHLQFFPEKCRSVFFFAFWYKCYKTYFRIFICIFWCSNLAYFRQFSLLLTAILRAKK